MPSNSRKTKNSKKQIKRRHVLSIVAVALLLSVALVPLIGLRYAIDDIPLPQPPGGGAQAEMLSVSFYFRDEDGRWGSEQRRIEADEDETVIIRAVLAGLFEGPQSIAFLPSIPDSVTIEEARLRTAVENTLRITFSQEFAYIEPLAVIDITSSLVHTLTDLEFINQLEFFIGDEPMRDGDGDEFGFRSRQNTSLAEDVPTVIVDTAVVMLYFPDDMMMGLVGQQRTIDINPQEDIERFILDALIEGPHDPSLYPAIPPTMAYNTLERIGVTDMIIVDFTQDFFELLLTGGHTAEEMVVYSLVNTLTARPETRRVQIFIDGQPIQPDEDGNLHIDLSGPLERNEDLIIGYLGE